MNKPLTMALAAATLALAPAAHAATTIITPALQPAGTSFLVGGNIFTDPTITLSFGHVGIPLGDFTDLFQFRVPQNGSGSGSATTGTTTYFGATDLDFTSVKVNGMLTTPTFRDIANVICLTPGVGTCGANETFAISNVAITANALNTIELIGMSRGNGSFGGNATFIASAVPEPATWGMMLLGFGMVGVTARRRRRSDQPKLVTQ